ncbi:hypothetical protein B8V81_4399 [Paenibacillus pasadenensis]|uniref:Uncharacterized protein n=1 Tax=Paenibacillus pasadenensis TaxID=217090 RepID=A0A2N5N6K0_9BACL|nr:hypothetical protein B8V81_4399 [Paenibacillus pasadenensis]
MIPPLKLKIFMIMFENSKQNTKPTIWKTSHHFLIHSSFTSYILNYLS